MLKLRNGAEEHDSAVYATLVSLRHLLAERPIVLHDLVVLCHRDGSLSSTCASWDVLKSLALVDEAGNVHETVRNVVLSAVDGSSLLSIRDPIAPAKGPDGTELATPATPTAAPSSSTPAPARKLRDYEEPQPERPKGCLCPMGGRGVHLGSCRVGQELMARAGEPPPPPSSVLAGPEPTAKILLTELERALVTPLVEFGLELMQALGGQIQDINAAQTEMAQRALAYVTGVPFDLLVGEILQIETVEVAPETARERFVRVKLIRSPATRIIHRG